MPTLRVFGLGLGLSLLALSLTLAGDFGLRPVFPSASLKQILADVSRYDGKTVRVEGTIKDVCQKKGCWLVVTDGKRTMRVKFKDYSFFVPLGSAGKPVTLEGVVHDQTLSESEAKHYASESKGGSPESIRGPQKTVSMMAEGVWIEGTEPPAGRAPMSQPESGNREAGSGSSR